MSRHLLSWKTLFYGACLPALRRLGPSRADAALSALGRLAGILPVRRRLLTQAADRALAHLDPSPLVGECGEPAKGGGPGRSPRRTIRSTLRADLAANIARHLARDYPLEAASDTGLAARFDVNGFEPVAERLAAGRGLLILGCHFGAHLAAVHWMVRRDLPVRLLVQRPRHVSPTLDRWFDRREPGDPYPQSAFFLRRGLPPAEAAARVLRARDALRAGKAVYLNGDIPWAPPAGRPGRLLGVERPFLALWADLAVLAGVPVVPLFATHRPGGRYALTFDPPRTIPPAGQADAVAAYIARLDAAIAADPAEAVPHLTWPTYDAPVTRPPTTLRRECHFGTKTASHVSR